MISQSVSTLEHTLTIPVFFSPKEKSKKFIILHKKYTQLDWHAQNIVPGNRKQCWLVAWAMD